MKLVGLACLCIHCIVVVGNKASKEVFQILHC